MSTLLIKFKISLVEVDGSFPGPSGPLFSFWLPEGEKDAIVLDTEEQGVELAIWFERRGFIGRDGFIYYDSKRNEVDDAAVGRQAILDAGQLYGRLTLNNVIQEQFDAVVQDLINTEGYVKLGKYIVNSVLSSRLSKFVDFIRTRSGQYWLSPLRPWDARRESLGNYCSRLYLSWSADNGVTWHAFRPNTSTQTINIGMSDYTQYMTREYWSGIVSAEASTENQSTAALVLLLAHQFLEDGNLRQAIIEGVTALEVAIDESFPSMSADSLKQKLGQFKDIGVAVQVAVVGVLMHLPNSDLETVLEVIGRRNQIVHEGWNPSNNPIHMNQLAKDLKVLFQVVARLIPGPLFLFPGANHGNKLI